MSGPKHLWSGDWQSESTRPPAPPARAVLEPEPEPEPQAERRWLWRQVAIAACASLIIAAVAFAVTAALEGSSKPRPRSQTHSRAAPPPNGNSSGSGGRGLTTATTTTNAYSATADWLGMQIVNSPTGIFINAMNTGGGAAAAGLEPGDEIVAINNHNIDSLREIRSDTKGIKIGGPVEITVMRNSVQVQALMPMMQRPTIHP